jgi:hypothetical protein
MNSDIGHFVRQGLDRLTAGATGAGDVLARARQQHRRRARAVRFTAAGATAAIAVVAVVVAGGLIGSPTAGHRTPPGLTAYVTSRAENALAGRGATDVLHATVVTEFHGTVDRMSGWSDARASRTLETLSSGRRQLAVGYLERDGQLTMVVIDYPAKTWEEQRLRSGRVALSPVPVFVLGPRGFPLIWMPGSCARVAPRPRLADYGLATFVRQMLSCGGLKVTGHGKVDGEAAIKLVTAGLGLVPSLQATLWVSRASYLPLRLTYGSLSSDEYYRVDFRWLPATPANLARANILPAPAGFRQVP